MAVPTLAPLAPLLAPADFAATLPPHAVSASVLLTDAAGRILMLHQARGYPGHPAWWQLPGGLGDPGEDPVATARRETAEETGILLTAVLRPLVVDYRCAADGWPPVIDFAFDAGAVAAGREVRLSAEHDAWAWRTYDEWLPDLQPEQRAWFASLWRAHRTATTMLLTDGRDVTAGAG
ncbi:NUDIX hydrolase [Kitasatospora aburaviensis]|uniref:NUDIX domain-containing protein n=1 Tax=Kitasatospora aburaviensis TaxID=67265 RepID=A0ABW1F4K4_9ACTN